MLKENEWLVINEMTYQMAVSENTAALRRFVMQQMRFLLDFDIASFYLLRENKETGGVEPVDVVCEGIELSELEEYLDEDIADDYAQGLFFTGKTVVYRESDIIQDEERIKTTLYKRVYEKRNMHFSVTVYLFFQRKFIGMLTFFRQKGKENFSFRDVYVLEAIKEHLAFHLAEKSGRKNSGQKSGDYFQQLIKPFAFSQKETEVVKALLTAEDIPEIADKLFISVSTLRKHIQHIYAKMSINNRVQLMAYFYDSKAGTE